MEKNIWKQIQAVRQHSPLVHNITNYVVMNNTANALLAIGASPIMAHAKSEIRDMVGIASSLVINIGTLDEYWSEAMLVAAETAYNLQKPWVLDPVGAGATAFRDQLLRELMKFKPTVVRGNASEIMALAKANLTTTKGVDSTKDSTEAIAAAKSIAKQYQTTVSISGATDVIIEDQQTFLVHNGHPLMTKVTGLGCSASAIVAAFVSLNQNIAEATLAAMALIGVAGQIAEQQSIGPGSLQLNLIDKLYNLKEQEFLDIVNIEKI